VRFDDILFQTDGGIIALYSIKEERTYVYLIDSGQFLILLKSFGYKITYLV
jgi:hypothetical protein